jgi:hypothetical protein
MCIASASARPGIGPRFRSACAIASAPGTAARIGTPLKAARRRAAALASPSPASCSTRGEMNRSKSDRRVRHHRRDLLVRPQDEIAAATRRQVADNRGLDVRGRWHAIKLSLPAYWSRTIKGFSAIRAQDAGDDLRRSWPDGGKVPLNRTADHRCPFLAMGVLGGHVSPCWRSLSLLCLSPSECGAVATRCPSVARPLHGMHRRL